MWAIAVLASLAVLITLALCVPLDVALRMDTEKKPKLSIKLVWLFGLVNLGLRRKRDSSQRKLRSHQTKGNIRTAFHLLRTKGLLTRLIKLLRDILRCIKIRELGADLKVALDNPADTGLLFAFVAPLNLRLRSLASQEIRIEPSFDDTFLKGYFQGKARLQPIHLIPPLLEFTFSPPAIRALKRLISTRWERRQS